MNADPRGPLRTVMQVDRNEPGNEVRVNGQVVGVAILFDCGHTGSFVAHFDYKVGSQMHCFQCGPYGKDVQ